MSSVASKFICAGIVIAAFFATAWPLQALAEVLERQVTRGPVEVMVRVEPADPLIGDPIHLEIEALAPDGVELLMPEFGEALERFLILDFAPDESIAADGRTRNLQRYTLEPPQSGEHSIPPLLIEFVDRRPGAKPAPEGADAYEILTERIDFTVQSVVPKNAGNDLRPMPGRLSPLGILGVQVWWWILLVLAACAIGLPFAYRAFLARAIKRRQRSAHQIASSDLEALLQWESRPSGDKLQEFYIKLSGIIRRYLEDRFNLRSPELTTEEFLILASSSPDLSVALRSLLGDFLKRADLVKFAGLLPAQEEVDESIRAARLFLEQTRDPDESPEAPRFEESAA